MENLYRDEKVNLMSILLAWSTVIILGVTQYLVRYSIQDCLIFMGIGCIYIPPTIIFIINKHNLVVKYFMVFGTMLYIYIVLFIQNGLFDNTYFLLITIAFTAVYFDVKLTIYSAFINVILSSVFYVTLKALLFPIFRIDNFISLELAFILIGVVISIQTYWSKRILESYKSLYEKAIRDKLTNLYNRTYYEEFFAETVAKCKLENKELSIIIVDIDNFKEVNDKFGHTKGDVVLKGVSERICSVCGIEDVAARIGGEEFIIILLDTNTDEASILAEEIRMKINLTEIENISISVSLGVTSLNYYDTKEDIFNRADKALYMAKNSGKNCSFVL